jgi:hypothetical protein
MTDHLLRAPHAPDDAQAADRAVPQDEQIIERLEENPEDPDAQLDAALEASMDGSDPVSIVQPGRSAEPAPTDGQHGADSGVGSSPEDRPR